MPRACAICFKSMSHAHRDNDHEGNSPENGIYRKFDVEFQATMSAGCATCLRAGLIFITNSYSLFFFFFFLLFILLFDRWSEECP